MYFTGGSVDQWSQIEKQDATPDLHQSEKSDPDPHLKETAST